MNKTISGNLKSVWLYMLIAFALLPIIILSLILRLRILFDSILIMQTCFLFVAFIRVVFTTGQLIYLILKEGITNDRT